MSGILPQVLLPLLIIFIPSQLALHFWPEWSLVNGVRVDYLSPTLYFTDILIFGLMAITRSRPRVPRWMIVFTVLNILISHSPLVSIYKWLRLLEYFWLYKYLVKNLTWTLGLGSWALSASVIWSSLLAWAQFLHQGAIGGWLYWLGERSFNISTPGIAKIALPWDLGIILRPYATLPHPNALAGYLLVSSLIIYSLKNYLKIENWKLKVGDWSLVIAALTVPVTFSRTAIILEVAVLASFLVIVRKLKLKTIILLVLTLSTVSYLLFTSFGNPSSLSERQFLISKAYHLIALRPILGVGLGNFIPSPYPLVTTPYSLVLQPVHNIYLLLASELGLPAVFFVCYLIIVKLINYLKFENWKLVVPILAVLITGLVDHYWLSLHQNTLLLVLLLAVIKLRPAYDQ